MTKRMLFHLTYFYWVKNNKNLFFRATFAIMSPDSTCTYYDLVRGIVDINIIPNYKQVLDKREQHDAQIRNKRPMIEQDLNLRSALPPITIQNTDDDVEVDQININHSRQWFAKNW